MTQEKYSTGRRKFQHLTKEKRAQIEILLRPGLPKAQIAKAVGIARSTLYLELLYCAANISETRSSGCTKRIGKTAVRR